VHRFVCGLPQILRLIVALVNDFIHFSEESPRVIVVKVEMFHYFSAENAERAERIGFMTIGFFCDLIVLCGEFLGLPK
jgi:hypothetical protein